MNTSRSANCLVALILVATLLAGCTTIGPVSPATPGASTMPMPPTVAAPPPTAVPTVAAPAATAAQPVTINFWEWFGGAWGDFFEQEARLFHDKYPDITVKVSHYPDQKAYREALALAFQSGSAPDTFLRRHTYAEVMQNNWTQPLDPWITPEWLAKFPAGSFVETKNVWGMKTYAFPVVTPKFDRVLYVNEELFRKAGLVDSAGVVQSPKTWGDVRAMAKRVTETGKGAYYGVGIGIKDARHMSWWFDLANLAGAASTYEIDYRTGQYTFSTNPVFTQLMELLLGMKADGSVYPYESTLDDSNAYVGFGQGKYAMFLSGSWAANNLKRDFPDFRDYRIVPLPVPDEGRRGGLPMDAGSGQYYMSSSTTHPNEAWLWLDWISSRGFHERFVKAGLDYSVYADLNTPQNITDSQKLQAYEAVTKDLVMVPFPPARNPDVAKVIVAAVVPDIGDVMVGIYTGQIKDMQAAFKDLDARKLTALEAAIQKARDGGAKVTIQDFIFPDWDPTKSYVMNP